MRALIQRVTSASVDIGGRTHGRISRGILILLGITHSDSRDDAAFLAEKCVNLRIFEDPEGKMNLSLLDVGGEALVVSQFTLYGDCRRGRRPSFTDAARPEHATPLYEMFIEEVRAKGVGTANGVFGADMQISLCNDGPVTILAESDGR